MSKKYEELNAVIENESLARKVFQQEFLGNSLPLYDTVKYKTTYVIGELGQNVLSISNVKRTIVPEYEVPRPSELHDHPSDFNVNVVASSYVKFEEERLFSLLGGAFMDSGNNDMTLVDAEGYDQKYLMQAFKEIEANDLEVGNVLLHPSDIDHWGFDLQRDTGLSQTSHKGFWRGVNVYASSLCTKNRVYVTTKEEFFGRFPVSSKVSLTSELEEGMYLYNTKGMSVIKQTQ